MVVMVLLRQSQVLRSLVLVAVVVVLVPVGLTFQVLEVLAVVVRVELEQAVALGKPEQQTLVGLVVVVDVRPVL
jgi:hypothetical protein